MPKRTRSRKSRRHPEPHFSRYSPFVIDRSELVGTSKHFVPQQTGEKCECAPTPAPPQTCENICSHTDIEKPHMLSPLISRQASENGQLETTFKGTTSFHVNDLCTKSPPTAPFIPSDDSSADVSSRSDEENVTTNNNDVENSELVFSDFLNPNVFDAFEKPLNDVDSDSQQLRSTFSLEQNDSDQEESIIAQSKHPLMCRPTFMGIMSLYGKSRYTLDNYDLLVAFMKDSNDDNTLPSPSTMRQHIFPRLIKHHFVPSSIHSFPSKHGIVHSVTESGASTTSSHNESVVILPSDWAKLDIASLHILREIVCIDSCRCCRTMGNPDLRIDSTTHVKHRSKLSSRSEILWVNNNGCPHPAIIGTRIRLHISGTTLAMETARFPDLQFYERHYRGDRCVSFDADIISSENVVRTSLGTITLEHGLPCDREEMSNNTRRLHNRCLEYLKSCCTPTNDNNNYSTDSEDDSEDDVQLQTRRTKRQSFQHKACGAADFQLTPSDHITLLDLQSDSTMAVLISRFWVSRITDDRNIVLFICLDSNDKISVHKQVTFGAPTLVQNATNIQESEVNHTKCYTTGKLTNGTRFYMYRLLLYADDFNPRSTLFPKGSVGGVYMSPSGLNVRCRRSQSTIRTISLTPSGVSTNMILDYVINDLVNGSIDGFTCIDAYGEKVHVFLDIMGFVGDYPASAAVVDVKGHTATAPCTLCSFTRNNIDGSSRYAFTTSVTSANNSFRRTQLRSETLREMGISKQDCRNLGMKHMPSYSLSTQGLCPLLKLASKYNAKSRSMQERRTLPSYKMDGYDLNIIAPDHLITGIFKGILTLCFIQISCESSRNRLQILIQTCIKEAGFQKHNSLFKKGKLVPGLSMSTLYCILSILPASLESLGLLDDLPPKQMLLHLHRFSSLAFWWPSLETDGAKAWEFVHGSGMTTYHRTMQVVASNFVKSVNKYSCLFPDLGHHVDRPNVHRLLELALHSLPLYNHCYYICELVFESAHQPLKYYLSRNHTHKSHIYSVQLILAKDWLVRLWSLWYLHKDEFESERDKHFALLGILRFIGGREIDDSEWYSIKLTPHLQALRDHIYYIMEGTVEKRLKKWYSECILHSNNTTEWELLPTPRNTVFPDDMQRFFDTVSTKLSSLPFDQSFTFQPCMKAVLKRDFGSSSREAHERIILGDVIQVLLRKGFETSQFLDPYKSHHATPHFLVVGALFNDSTNAPWAVVKSCSFTSSFTPKQIPEMARTPVLQIATPHFYSRHDSSNFYLIKLTNVIRKVGLLHNCKTTNSCSFSNETNQLNHNTTSLRGGLFFVLTRSMGYPPRRS